MPPTTVGKAGAEPDNVARTDGVLSGVTHVRQANGLPIGSLPNALSGKPGDRWLSQATGPGRPVKAGDPRFTIGVEARLESAQRAISSFRANQTFSLLLA
jgi:hypothetical protein